MRINQKEQRRILIDPKWKSIIKGKNDDSDY